MIALVLVEPESPGNIGAAARAAKNMGIRDLRLVKPPADWRAKAKMMAVQAADRLDHIRVFDSLEEAVQDCKLVAGTTRRAGSRRNDFVPFQDAVEKIKPYAKTKDNAAILFGKESKGLDNRSLRLCHFLIMIPSHADYPSLNLAQAVMVLGFSLFIAPSKKKEPAPNKLSQKDLEELLEAFSLVLEALQYTPALRPRIRSTFHRLLKRSEILEPEANMFKGLFRRICEISGSRRTDIPQLRHSRML